MGSVYSEESSLGFDWIEQDQDLWDDDDDDVDDDDGLL